MSISLGAQGCRIVTKRYGELCGVGLTLTEPAAEELLDLITQDREDGSRPTTHRQLLDALEIALAQLLKV